MGAAGTGRHEVSGGGGGVAGICSDDQEPWRAEVRDVWAGRILIKFCCAEGEMSLFPNFPATAVGFSV